MVLLYQEVEDVTAVVKMTLCRGRQSAFVRQTESNSNAAVIEIG